MKLTPINYLNIVCSNCKEGTLENNLKCNNCGTTELITRVERKVSGELTRLNTISIYQMEQLGIDSAITASNHEEFKIVFRDFEEWYNEKYGKYGKYVGRNYVVLEGV